MTPKEKAKELVYKFDNTMEFSTPQRFAKKCAMIAVDEILQNVYDDRATIGRRNLTDKEYWTEVKQEIENL
jgi:hypothetical protein